eukprot:TRINITY_DN3146_c0_g1_i3.p1 TRINITY_DN3146_c0_g1~~TRINITY_DN3146_c0_g1_i3.p1  ORF type:complete len:511 (-),score=134.51 TRINITY_DN3146_c0_g1_i3:147-1655(-)
MAAALTNCCGSGAALLISPSYSACFPSPPTSNSPSLPPSRPYPCQPFVPSSSDSTASRLSRQCTQRLVGAPASLCSHGGLPPSSSCVRALSLASNFNLAELAPPPIDGDLHDMMAEKGAVFSEDGVPQTFGNDADAMNAAISGVAVYDMSHFGRLRVTGEDRIRFLHNQTTADMQQLREGQGCETVFVTPTARTIDLATAWIMKNSVLLFVSPGGMAYKLQQLMNKYIFFADKVEVDDISNKTQQLAVIGPKSHELMRRLGLEKVVGGSKGSHEHFSVRGQPVTVGVGSGFAVDGYWLLLSSDVAGDVWVRLVSEGAVPMGEEAWNAVRIAQGRPSPGSELTEEFNPLEAGLWHCISTSKGCYMGQETIARLITYDGVKQQLWGVRLPAPVPPGSAVFLPPPPLTGTAPVKGGEEEDTEQDPATAAAEAQEREKKKVGKLTSCSLTPSLEDSVAGEGAKLFTAMAYIRKQAAAAEGTPVEVAGVTGGLFRLPYVSYSLGLGS